MKQFEKMNNLNQNLEPSEVRVTDLFSHNLLRAMEKAGHSKAIETTFPDYSDQEITALRQEIADTQTVECENETIMDEEITNASSIMTADINRACPEIASSFIKFIKIPHQVRDDN